MYEKQTSTIYSTDTCPICYDDIGKTNVATTSCGHVFCLKCISKHVAQGNGDCPMCKTEFVEDVKQNSSGYNYEQANEVLQHHLRSTIDMLEYYLIRERPFRYQLMMKLSDNTLLCPEMIETSDAIDEIMSSSERFIRHQETVLNQREQFVHRLRPRRNCGVCKRPGHNRRRCPNVQM